MKFNPEQYLAPISESAQFKGVPMSERESAWVKSLTANGAGYVRYRGPRRPGDVGQRTCLKEDATSFAIYSNQQVWVA